MKTSEHSYPSLEEARKALHAFCSEARAAGRRPVVLVESHARAMEERRLLAAAGTGFGVEVTTLGFWVADLLKLHGSGAVLVGSTQRSVLMAKLLAESESGLPKTAGMVNLLCQAAQVALVWRTLPADLVGNEKAFVAVLDAYAAELAAQGVLEYCEALQQLAQADLVNTYDVFVFDQDIASFSAVERDFLQVLSAGWLNAGLAASPNAACADELNNLAAALFKREKNDAPTQPTGALTVALAAGPTAEHKLVADCIQQVFAQKPTAHVVVAAKDPTAEFDYCAQQLSEQGIAAQLQGATTFAQTDAGRAVLDLVALTSGEALNKLEAADYSFNPFAGIWYGSAFRADQVNRANRLFDANDVLTEVASNAAPELQGVIALFEEADFEAALDVLEKYSQQHFAARPAYLMQQLRAFSLAREYFVAATNIGAPLELVAEGLANHTLGLRLANSAQDAQSAHGTQGVQDAQDAHDAGNAKDAQDTQGAHNSQNHNAEASVLFTTLYGAAQLPPASTDAVVITNLNTQHYPVRPPENALQTLLEKWGKAQVPNTLLRMRKAFFRTVCVAQTKLFVERALNDEVAEPAQPAILFEELLDAYREDLNSFEDKDETLLLPAALLPFTIQAGEENLTENALGAPTENSQHATLPPAGAISAAAKDLLVLSRNYNGSFFEGADLSASQIESYLECPYQWFAKRRLRISSIDEGFGPLERGTFMHNVLQAFYVRFIDEVAPKVTHENLETARAMLAEVFVQQTEYDRAQRNPGNRYVPIDAWETQVHDALLPQLQESLKFEADFMPRFRPLYFEWGYGEDTPFSYAGCNLVGRIDRIDVDDAGHAVVVDYKSSLSPDYRLRAKDEGKGGARAKSPQTPQGPEDTQDLQAAPQFVLPRKMQTLIYAKVVRDQLGLQLAGALYFNPLTGAVQGAFDHAVLGPQDFPTYTNADAQANEVPGPGLENFEALIVQSENAVAERIEELLAGNIDPAPISPHACEYCPVGGCVARLAARKV